MIRYCMLALLLYPAAIFGANNWNNRVYLASYPRSGNHWVRFLIEEATGVATASVYCDAKGRDYHRDHLPTMFPWGYCPDHGFEGTRRYPAPNDIIVLKTHFPVLPAVQLDNQPSIRTILLIRHPVDCLFSQHVHTQPEGQISKETIEKFLSEWNRFQDYWESKPEVVVIRYEDLYNAPVSVLTKICTIAGLRVQDRDIKRAVSKYPPLGGIYKHIRKFNPEDLKILHERLQARVAKYGYSVKG